MTPTLVREHLSHAAPVPPRVDLCARARDWSEIQERMLVPLFETVYERLEVGPATRLLGLRCGSGLALLMAATRGAAVTGVDSSPERLALARERLLPHTPGGTRTRTGPTLLNGAEGTAGAAFADGAPGEAAGARTPAYTLVTVFEPVGCPAGDPAGLDGLLAQAVPLTGPEAAVVLAGWGPPERCATASVLRLAGGPARPSRGAHGPGPAPRDALADVARRAGLEPAGSGRVACPFGYADLASAVRGLLSTGLFDAAIAATDGERVRRELTRALGPHRRADGTVWMPNVFRYLIARVPGRAAAPAGPPGRPGNLSP